MAGGKGGGGGQGSVPGVSDTSEGVVPGQEGGQETEAAARVLQRRRGAGVAVGLGELRAREHEEGQVQGEEQEEEHDGGPQRAEQQDEREDEPARQEEAEHRGLVARVRVRIQRVEAGREEDGVREPETAVRRQRRRTERVTYGHFPGGKVSREDSMVQESI